MPRLRRRREALNIWPGFVDALASLLMVVIFVLMTFVITQFLLTDALSGRDEALKTLRTQISALAQDLSLTREKQAKLQSSLQDLQNRFQLLTAEKASLQNALEQSEQDRAFLTGRLAGLQTEREALRNRLAESEAELARSRQENDRLLDDMTALQTDQDALQARLQELEALKKTLEQELTVSKEQLVLRLADLERLERDIAALKEVRTRLDAEIASLTGESQALRDRTKTLEAALASEQEKTALAQKDLQDRDIRLEELLSRNTEAEAQIDADQREIAALKQSLEALRSELARLSRALEASEAEIARKDVEILNLGERLNRALADKVAELARYRSEFFGKLREVLGDREDIRIVGDRFVFQSEVLFASGSASLGLQGEEKLAELASSLRDIAAEIPESVNWVLRVDGHTDQRPIHSDRYESNWELSTARAISVVRFLAGQGVPENRLAAAGFASFQPLDSGDSEEALRRNRRIEIKFDQRIPRDR